MDKLIPIHHSLADWNFQAGRGFAIGNDRFISPPSALRRPTDATQGTSGNLALKEAVSGNLMDGRLTTYVLSEHAVYRSIVIFFRSQQSPHLGLPANTYRFTASYASTILDRLTGGSQFDITTGSPPVSWDINEWHRFRFTWYTWLDANLEPILRAIIDQEVNAVWQQLLLWDIANPLWQTSPTNLIGIQLGGSHAGTQVWIDDTLVYKRA